MLRTVSLALLLAVVLASSTWAAQDRIATIVGYIVVIDGQSIGPVRSVSGGGVFADVIAAAGGQAGEKQPGPPRYEDIAIELPVTSPAVPLLVGGLMQGSAPRKDGSVTAVDSNGRAVSEMRFNSAAVIEVVFPGCDGAASPNPGFILVKLSPEQIARSTGGGAVAGGGVGAGDRDASWSPRAFRLDIDGLDCRGVSRIEPLTVRQPLSTDAVGDARDYQRTASPVEFGNLRLVILRSSAASFEQWFDEFLLRGNNQQEKNGSLTLLNADLSKPLLVINLRNLGIVRMSPVPMAVPGPEQVLVEMYCERMEIAGAGNATGGADAGGAAEADAEQTASTDPPPATQPVGTPLNRTLRDRTGAVLTNRETIARPGTRIPPPEQKPMEQSTAFRLQPNAKLAAQVGRLVVRFPEGTVQREDQVIQLPKSKEERSGEMFYGSMAKELPPGTYLVSVNGMLVEGVKVEVGSDTYLSVGVLRVKAPEGQQYEVILEDFDNAPAIAVNVASKDIALPVGNYFLRLKGNMTPFSIEDGQFTEFAAPE